MEDHRRQMMGIAPAFSWSPPGDGLRANWSSLRIWISRSSSGFHTCSRLLFLGDIDVVVVTIFLSAAWRGCGMKPRIVSRNDESPTITGDLLMP